MAGLGLAIMYFGVIGFFQLLVFLFVEWTPARLILSIVIVSLLYWLIHDDPMKKYGL